MKKIVSLYLFLACFFLVFTGCSKDSHDNSVLTYYVQFDFDGDKDLFVPVGSEFTVPNVKATEKGEDVTSKMEIDGAELVNSNEVGVYPIVYSAVNVDGYESVEVRTIYVYDPETTLDLSGDHDVSDESYRLFGGTSVYYGGYKVNITRLAPGIFSVSDFFGGYYDKRAGYGGAYAMTGYFSLHKDNSITLISSYIGGWGDSLDSLEDVVYDPIENTLSWTGLYSGSEMEFHVRLELNLN